MHAYIQADRWYRLVDHEPVQVHGTRHAIELAGQGVPVVRVTLEEWPYGFTIHADAGWSRLEYGRLHDKIETERQELLGGAHA